MHDHTRYSRAVDDPRQSRFPRSEYEARGFHTGGPVVESPPSKVEKYGPLVCLFLFVIILFTLIFAIHYGNPKIS